MKSTEDQDSSDIIFDEVREKPLAPPEVGIFPDGPSVYPSSDNLNLSSEEEVGKVDEIPSINDDPSKQTDNDITSNNQKSSTSEIDIDDNLSGLNEFWELVEPSVEEEEDKVSELNFSLPHIDEPIDQEIDRGLQREYNEENVVKEPEAMKSGDSNRKSKSNKSSEVLKTYPKTVSRNKPPKYYGSSSYNPLNWV